MLFVLSGILLGIAAAFVPAFIGYAVYSIYPKHKFITGIFAGSIVFYMVIIFLE